MATFVYVQFFSRFSHSIAIGYFYEPPLLSVDYSSNIDSILV